MQELIAEYKETLAVLAARREGLERQLSCIDTSEELELRRRISFLRSEESDIAFAIREMMRE